jgi:UDP-N-acetylmuramoyl-tripeptide--D-alanyl-D-alanine ligase
MTIENLHEAFLLSAGICTDSRQDAKGKLFFALKGENFDGNLYVEDALEAGCHLAITETETLEGKPGVWYTPDALKLLQDLAWFHRRYASPEIVAITGSNGKTTTKELVAAILSRKFNVLATKGNLNNHIGVPLTLLSLQDEEMAVVEMGANHPGEIKTLAEIADPGLGLITNIGKAHLEGFGSLEGVLEAKGELYDYLALHEGLALVDGDDPVLIAKATKSGVKTWIVGSGGELNVVAKVIEQVPFLVIELEMEGTIQRIQTGLVGAYNLRNIKMAVAVGLKYGVGAGDMAEAISSYRPNNQRSQVIDGVNRVTLDSYNANPTSMREAIVGLLEYATDPTMIILGDMAELGDSSSAEHSDLVHWIGTLNIDRVCLVGPNFCATHEPSTHSGVFRDRKELEVHLSSDPPIGYQVLVKGSRVMELERLAPILIGNKVK